MIFILRRLGTLLLSSSTKRWDIFNSGFHNDGWSRRRCHCVSQCSSPLSRRRMVETPAKDTRYKSIKDYHTKLKCSPIAIDSWIFPHSISRFSSVIIYRVFKAFCNSHFQTYQEFIVIDQRIERLTAIPDTDPLHYLLTFPSCALSMAASFLLILVNMTPHLVPLQAIQQIDLHPIFFLIASINNLHPARPA